MIHSNLFLSALLCFSFTSHGNTISIPKKIDELALLRKVGTLRVGWAGENTPPFISMNESKAMSGVDVELAQAIAEKLGVQIEWIKSQEGFHGIFELLGKNKADIGLSALFPTVDRLSYARFSTPYLRIKHFLYVQRSVSARLKLPETFEELMKRSDIAVGHFSDSGFVDGLLKKSLSVKLIGFKGREKMIEAFIKGDVAAVWLDELELAKWRRNRVDIDLFGFTLAVPQGETPLVVAVSRDRPQLAEWIDLFVAQVERGAALQRIYSRNMK